VIRTQISLEPEQMERLRARSQATGEPLAALVRQAVDELLRSPPEGGAALDVLGRYRSGGPGDSATEHDRELDDAFGA
jgi:predicted DNA-binding protein